MKKIKIKFQDILTYDNLIKAYQDCYKTKKNRKDSYSYDLELGKELPELFNELKNKTYEVSQYCIFKLFDPKERDIFQPKFKDLIVQRLLYNAIYDEVDKRLFEHSYGVRKIKGMHACAFQATEFMKKSQIDNYYLQLDIKKFFKSIKKEHFGKIIDFYFKDRELKDMLLKFVFDIGVPIGNLLSGIFGMLFLTKMDFYIKHTLKAEKYIRFMDDFVIFDITKEQAKYFKEKIEEFISQLDITFSKIKINKIRHGINFVGFRIFKYHRFLRKRTIKRFKKGNLETKISIWGMTKKCHTRLLLLNILFEQGLITKEFMKNHNIKFIKRKTQCINQAQNKN